MNPPKKEAAPLALPRFDQYFKRVWDTRLKCPKCKGAIYYGVTKQDKTAKGPNYAYACGCLHIESKQALRIDGYQPYFRLSEWEWILDQLESGHWYGMAYGWPDFQKPDAKTKAVKVPLNQKRGIFDPASTKRGEMSRSQEWQHWNQIAIEAVEKLLELQEGFDDSRVKMPEAFAGTAKAEYYDQIIDVDLGSVQKALVELYDAQAIEEPPK